MRIGAPRLLAMGCAMLLAGSPLPARAGEYRSAGVGDTGLHLGNSATHTLGQYTSEEEALLRRFHALLCDVDILRADLAALPPELERSGQPGALAGPHAELRELFALGLRNNPELRPMRSELAALAARTRLAGAPEDPMAMLEFMDWPASPPLLDGLHEAGVTLGLSQEFASHGKRGLRRQVAGYAERIQQLKLESMELALCGEISDAYYEIAGSRAALRAMDRQLELMGILGELGEKRYALGQTPQASVLDIQLRLGLMEKQRVEMATMLAQQQQMLAGLLGHPPGFDPATLSYSFAYPQPVPAALDLPALLDAALAVHPAYRQLQLEIEQGRWNTELARREFYPDYKLGLSYSVGRMMQDSVSASIEVPLMTHKEERQDAMLQEAYAMQRVSEDRLGELPSALRRELANLQSELALHGELARRYGTALVPQARLAVESMLAGYASGMMPLDDVFMGLDRALGAENEYEQQQIHYVDSLARLQVATAGAFDPAPYLAQPPGPLPAGRAPGEALAGLAVAPAAEDGLQLPPVPVDAPGAPEAGQPQQAPPFVDSLELPAPADPADAPGFYEPFVPRGTQDER